MANIPIFEKPSWLNDQDAETTHKRMMESLPSDIDDTEGGFSWDFSKPVALEKSELLEFFLTETLKIMFPMWSYGEWLDYHAKADQLNRKPANAATGTVKVTGKAGIVIPAGFLFAAPSMNDTPAIEFQSKEEAIIGSNGVVEIEVQAKEAGVSGNVAAGTITMMVKPISGGGITGITNPEKLTGGTEMESDEELRNRIDEFDSESETSFVGNDSDYKRWAEETPGVGKALPVPEWNGPSTVKLVLLDSNGQPANETLINTVYQKIMSLDDRENRLAPIGAILTVAAPLGKTLNYSFALILKPGADKDSVITLFKTSLEKYYPDAKAEGEVKYQYVSSLLTQISGVKDFSGLTINNGTSNIILESDEYPVTGTITAEVGE